MSIQTDKKRIENAISAIKTSISNKNVVVPDGTKIDGLSVLIDKIPIGIDTSDATATSIDILKDKTAYVKGIKVIGTYENKNLNPDVTYTVENDPYIFSRANIFDYSNGTSMYITSPVINKSIYAESGCQIQILIELEDLANYIGLTADKIKSGEEILGITGTYTG